MKLPLGNRILLSGLIHGIFVLKHVTCLAQLRAGRPQTLSNENSAWRLHPEVNRNSLSILQITDVHLGEDPAGTWGPEQDKKSLQGLATLLNFEKPQLAVLTGDEVVSGNMGSISELKAYWANLVKPMERDGVHWCTVLGNHDSCGQQNCSHKVANLSSAKGTYSYDIAELAQVHVVADPPADNAAAKEAQAKAETVSKNVGKIFQDPGDVDEPEMPPMTPPPHDDSIPLHVPGPMKESSIRSQLLSFDRTFNLSRTGGDSNLFLSRSGTLSNYWLPVYASADAGAADRPAAILWFMDSGGGDVPEGVNGDMVAWLRYERLELQRQYGDLPGLLFMHMPSTEFRRMREHTVDCKGASDDFVTPPGQGTPSDLISAAAGAGVQWVFVGHNHGNDWCCRDSVTDDVGKSHDVSFCYGRHSGFGGYTTPDVLPPGARVVQLEFDEKEKISVKSWVRQIDGQVMSKMK